MLERRGIQHSLSDIDPCSHRLVVSEEFNLPSSELRNELYKHAIQVITSKDLQSRGGGHNVLTLNSSRRVQMPTFGDICYRLWLYNLVYAILTTPNKAEATVKVICEQEYTL
ncbi:hypothetical protein CEXT_743741 [Caerostris extrusa]|uniref:Uncharacterized protein n=1 Tax=Caerostris extrusa TaxID=172846 RepID=A0AAV4N7G2_CAEEX|nr:hypothetical protein CEXT_743741 [Caerostris extrusa]